MLQSCIDDKKSQPQGVCLAKTLSVPEINSLRNFLNRKICYDYVHVQLSATMFRTVGPLLSFTSQTTAGELGASSATSGT